MRKEALKRDWTKGSIIGNLLSLSWPIIVTQSLHQIAPLADMIWVGRLGAASIAGLGISVMAIQLLYMIIWGLATGMRAMVARSIGAGDAAGANHIAQQGFVVAGGFGIIGAVLGIFFTEPILSLFGLSPDVVAQGAAYLRIVFLGSAVTSFNQTTEGIMQASGDTVTPMKIGIFFRLLHVILVPFFVFGWWLFPHLGVRGAALTNILTQSLGLTLGLWVLFGGRTRLRLTLRNFHFNPSIIWRMVKISLPASLTGMERILANLVLIRIIVPFGTLAVAAKSLLRQVETPLITIPNVAWGRGAGVLAAQNLGADQPGRAARTGWLAVALAEAFVAIVCLAMLLLAERIFSIFGPNPQVITLASAFLRIAIIGYLVLVFGQVLNTCISDVGDTVPPMLFTLLSMWMIEIPLALWLPRATNLGVYGIIWATVIGTYSRALTSVAYFKLGRWKHKKV